MKKDQRISTLDTLISLRLAKSVLEELDSYISRNTNGRRNRSQVVNTILFDFLRKQKSLERAHKEDYLKEIGLTPGIKGIIEKIKSKGFDIETTQLDLEDAIKAVRGHDPRTLRNWMNGLLDIGFVKEKTRISWKQAVYEIDWSAVDESLWPDSIKNNGQQSKEAIRNES